MSHNNRDKQMNGRCLPLALAASFMLFLSLSGLVWISEAQALRLSMKRVVFEGPVRSDIITIMNNTAREQTYRLGWRRYRMDEKRSLVHIPEGEKADDIKWADEMVRYAPRRVVVPPGGSQQIRLLLRRPRDLAPGEYRAHLWIVTETEAEAFSADKKPEQGQQAFRLAMQPALTLPVFVRHGDLAAKASITDAKLAKAEGGGTVSFTLNREGNRSLYGDLKITCTASGQEFEASHTRGIAVYPEVDRRILEYDFEFPAEQAANCRRVRIEYIADKEDSLYGGQVMAQATAQM